MIICSNCKHNLKTRHSLVTIVDGALKYFCNQICKDEYRRLFNESRNETSDEAKRSR